jgi:hypothetical protein
MRENLEQRGGTSGTFDDVNEGGYFPFAFIADLQINYVAGLSKVTRPVSNDPLSRVSSCIAMWIVRPGWRNGNTAFTDASGVVF